ncbi:MAG: hypothetical protein K2X63_04230, partial [Burkholderiaceae bacterium]|nr:hypothetical protein [Burkholderiaceae bacterium]
LFQKAYKTLNYKGFSVLITNPLKHSSAYLILRNRAASICVQIAVGLTTHCVFTRHISLRAASTNRKKLMK